MLPKRPSLDDTWSRVARVIAERGTCSRLQVGAVLTRDGRVVSTGFNGAPAGTEHCVHLDDQPCERSIHAETNVLGYAARHTGGTQGATMYITHAPCRPCASIIIAAGVERVVYEHEYRSDAGVAVLREAGVTVERVWND